jgi:cysteine-rich repeat protein
VCTTDRLIGAGCNLYCGYVQITSPLNGDGCCPSGANANNDNDCAPVCGNKLVEPTEGCDDGNTAAGDGCANCQIETSEQMCLGILGTSDACATCSCQKCQSVTVSCFGSADATKNARCKALVDCGRAKGCSGTDCYCGSVDLFTCLFGGGNGRCRAEVEAAAETTVPLDIQSRASDTYYALGRANAVAECGLASCATPCDL